MSFRCIALTYLTKFAGNTELFSTNKNIHSMELSFELLYLKEGVTTLKRVAFRKTNPEKWSTTILTAFTSTN